MQAESSVDPMTGRTIANRYHILKKIAEGGIGSVYLAADRRMMGRNVVVKFLLEGMVGRDDVLRKFEHEKEALSRLDHPGIVSILDSGTVDGGKPFIVMPFVEGRTLHQILRGGTVLDWSTCAQIIESVTGALSAAHSRGVLHRDVKPANIMISPLPNAKLRILLIDFGIARVFESQVSPITEVGRPLGTILYVAPEQLEGIASQTPAADNYSCGVVAYELLTGNLPFQPKSMMDMLRLQRDGLAALPSDVRREIPRSIDHIIFKALAYDPVDRYQDADEFGSALCKELRKKVDGNLSIPPLSMITRPKMGIVNVPAPPEMPDANLLEDMKGQEAASIGEVTTVTRDEAEAHRRTSKASNAGSSEVGRKNSRSVRAYLVPIAAIAAALIIGAVFIMGTVYYWVANHESRVVPSTNQPAPIAKANTLEVQLAARLTADNAPPGQPYQTDESEVFTKNIGLALNVRSQAAGYLCIFSESDAEPGVFDVVFPTSEQHRANPRINAGEQIQTAYNTFEGPPGTDTLWIVWSKDEQPAVKSAFEDATSAISEKSDRPGSIQDRRTVSNFEDFLRQNSADHPQAAKDTSKMLTLQSQQAVIVYPLKLKHR